MTAQQQSTKKARSGGRAPQHRSMPSLGEKPKAQTWMSPSDPSQARLTLVQVTDVYTLDNWAGTL